jgi:hypothetical protein
VPQKICGGSAHTPPAGSIGSIVPAPWIRILSILKQRKMYFGVTFFEKKITKNLEMN